MICRMVPGLYRYWPLHCALASGMAAREGEAPHAGLQRSRQPGPAGRRPTPFSDHGRMPRRGAGNFQQSVIYRRDLERRLPNGYESGGAVRAALGRGNPASGLVPAVTAPHSLTLWSGSLWRMQQVHPN